MKPTARECDLVARTIAGEARSEPWLGQVAIGWVIRNRSSRPGWWGHDIEGVCLAPAQFSCWHDQQRSWLETLDTDRRAYRVAYAAAVVALEGLEPDPTGGATHYYAPAAMQPPGRVPDWAGKLRNVAVIGGHRFFREDS